MSLAIYVDYSIVICTYNPDERLLERCLDAILLLDTKDLFVEVILVDNNSTTPLANVSYIQEFLVKMQDSIFIVVKEQGLTNARIAAISIAKGTHIVFFDDDNEPHANYLQELRRLNFNYENVGAWGPGKISVDFIDGINESLAHYARSAFQQRDEEYITFANIRSWQNCYPFGTGLCVKASLLKLYHDLVKQQNLSMTGRTGSNMNSGEDTQIVLFCIKQGCAAGVSPNLKLVHIIPGKRSNFIYLKRLTYGTAACYSPLLIEVFPENRIAIEQGIPRRRKLLSKILKGYIKISISTDKVKTLQFINYVAATTGHYISLNMPVPKLLVWATKRMKIG